MKSENETKKELINIEKDIEKKEFSKAVDFFRLSRSSIVNPVYHHIGIYAFTNITLTKYVKLSRSRLEIKRNLEQMRAMENNFVIKVGLSDNIPLGIDTVEDLKKITKEMS